MIRRLCGREQEWGMRVLPSDIYKKPPPIHYGEQNIGLNLSPNFFIPWRWYLSVQIIEAIKVCYPATFYFISRAFREGAVPIELQIPELWLENGSRVYIDDGKVEIASAESLVGSPESIIQEKANELIIYNAAAEAAKKTGLKRIIIYKNNTGPAIGRNTDSSFDVSFGTHQNYSHLVSVGDSDNLYNLLRHFIPVFLPISGGGGIVRGRKNAYVLSPRVLHIKEDLSQDTVHRRGVVNQRDESLMYRSDGLRRLHVISRDGTRCEFQTWLVDMLTHLAIRLVEEGWRMPPEYQFSSAAKALNQINDEFLGNPKLIVRSNNIIFPTRYFSLPEYQKLFLSAFRSLKPLSDQERDAIDIAFELVALFEAGSFKKLVGKLDWATKLHFLKIAANKGGFDFNDVRAWRLDVGYHDISPSPKESWFAFLDNLGYIEHLVSDEEVKKGINVPPPTRAASRGKFVRKCFENPELTFLVSDLDWEGVAIEEYPRHCFFGERHDPFSATSSTLEEFYKELPNLLKKIK